MKTFIRVWPVLITSILLFSACKKDSADSNSIVGKWELNSHTVVSNGVIGYNFNYESGKSYITEYYLNNTYTVKYYDSIIINSTYKFDSGKLSIRYIGPPNAVTTGTDNCLISGKTLTLSDSGKDASGNYIETWLYTRI